MTRRNRGIYEPEFRIILVVRTFSSDHVLFRTKAKIVRLVMGAEESLAWKNCLMTQALEWRSIADSAFRVGAAVGIWLRGTLWFWDHGAWGYQIWLVLARFFLRPRGDGYGFRCRRLFALFSRRPP